VLHAHRVRIQPRQLNHRQLNSGCNRPATLLQFSDKSLSESANGKVGLSSDDVSQAIQIVADFHAQYEDLIVNYNNTVSPKDNTNDFSVLQRKLDLLTSKTRAQFEKKLSPSGYAALEDAVTGAKEHMQINDPDAAPMPTQMMPQAGITPMTTPPTCTGMNPPICGNGKLHAQRSVAESLQGPTDCHLHINRISYRVRGLWWHYTHRQRQGLHWRPVFHGESARLRDDVF